MIIAIANLQLMLRINFPITNDYINNFVYASFLFLNFVIIDCDRMGKFRLWLHSYDSVNGLSRCQIEALAVNLQEIAK